MPRLSVPSNKLKLVVGLGNPGAEYRNTRHNTGFMVVDKIALDFHIALTHRKFDSVFGRGDVKDVAVVLAKPMAFMNRSGPPVQKLAHYYRIQRKDMLVIHDDIDLAYGRLKIKEKGGHGGHNGIRSLMDAFGGGDFVRLRIGVGRSEAGDDVTDHVLAKFSPPQSALLERIITGARDAAVTVLSQGTKVGMNLFNGRNLTLTE
ncbi:MAG: aminoacyl-tRNA hydrolase [Desulfobacterales bacterium]|nr:MAG: aminoacyl-tRNA hydrolase [Desulfobacterales bacterium]